MNLDAITLVDVFTVLASSATVALVLIIWRQSRNLVKQTGVLQTQANEMRRTNLLAHTPCLIPRQSQGDDVVFIKVIENIGTASAKNIKITLKSSLETKGVNVLGITPGQVFPAWENAPPLLKCKKGETITMSGTYQEITGEQVVINESFNLVDVYFVEENTNHPENS